MEYPLWNILRSNIPVEYPCRIFFGRIFLSCVHEKLTTRIMLFVVAIDLGR